MTEFDLLVLAPWAVFAAGVITIMLLAITRGRHRGRPLRTRHGRRRRR
jgi:hypothetical protein